MKRGISLIIISALLPMALFSVDYASLGQSLEKKMWEDMKEGNLKAVNEQIAPYFQSIHEDGARDKSQEMTLIKNLNLGNYKLSKFQVTEGEDDTIIVTYWVSVGETIDDERLSKAPEARLSVWQKNGGDTWQWIVHANLNPLKE